MRLIDADELIKDRVENDPVVIAAKCAPTAYDVDKVVERLEEVKYEDELCPCNLAVEIEEAKRIVKSGGVGRWEMKYKCIKEMCLPRCDGDGFEIPNEYEFVKVGSIWERNDRGNLIGGDVHLDSLDDDSDFGWVEMPIEDLEENFVLIE